MDPPPRKKRALINDNDISDFHCTEDITITDQLDNTASTGPSSENQAATNNAQISTIMYLENYSDLMQKLVTVQKDKNTGPITNAITSSCEPDHPTSSILPDIAVEQVLKNIPASDQQTILNSRLVSVQWNNTIEDTSKLMKKIAFPVWHAKPFLELEIVKKRKVKSISFKNPLQLYSKYTRDFFDLIGDLVENVEFAFEDDFTIQRELFNTVLERCNKLQVLVVKDARSVFGSTMPVTRHYIDEPEFVASKKLKRVSFNLRNFGTRDEAARLAFLLMKLPQLAEIELIGNPWWWQRGEQWHTIILKGLCEYLKKYAAELRLKKLSLSIGKFVSKVEQIESLVFLLIYCGKYSIAVEGLPSLNFNRVLAIQELLDLPATASLNQRPLFPTKVSGRLTFGGRSALINLDRLHWLNIENLCLNFNRGVMDGELNWIHEVLNLRFLILQVPPLRTLDFSWSIRMQELTNILSLGLPNLKALQISNDILSSIKPNIWLGWFPNLEHLGIHDCDFQDINLLLASAAASLECLLYLELVKLPNLDDTAFTQVQSSSHGRVDFQPSNLPVIACFKSLKKLKIVNCYRLTDDCVINGISRCTTLEKITIRSCAHLGPKCFEEFVKCEVDFSYERHYGQDNMKLKVLAEYEDSSESEDDDDSPTEDEDGDLSSD